MNPPRFRPEAEEEYEKAVAFYAAIDPDLGARFQARLEAAVTKAASSPKLYAPDRDHECRRCRVKKFPYSVQCLEMDDQIWIVAVAHQSRKPGYCRYRSRQR